MGNQQHWLLGTCKHHYFVSWISCWCASQGSSRWFQYLYSLLWHGTRLPEELCLPSFSTCPIQSRTIMLWVLLAKEGWCWCPGGILFVLQRQSWIILPLEIRMALLAFCKALKMRGLECVKEPISWLCQQLLIRYLPWLLCILIFVLLVVVVFNFISTLCIVQSLIETHDYAK